MGRHIKFKTPRLYVKQKIKDTFSSSEDIPNQILRQQKKKLCF